MDAFTVGGLMTPRPISVAPDTEFKEIAMLLTRERISAVPVVDRRGALVGVVSEADLLHKEALGSGPAPSRRAHRSRDKAAALRAADLMTSPARTIDIDAPVPVAAKALAQRCGDAARPARKQERVHRGRAADRPGTRCSRGEEPIGLRMERRVRWTR
jgi:CBS domain-containing protein